MYKRQALGVKFYDENQKLLSGMGENLPKVQTIDTEGVEKAMNEVETVSYTHLDVYKRQLLHNVLQYAYRIM